MELLQRFKDAFQEIPDEFRVNSDRTCNSPVVDYHSMFPAIGRAMKTVSPWTSISNTQCIVACPINEALIWLMNTRTGSEIFTRKDINAHFAIILQKWGRYLTSSDSAKAMHDQENGWLSTDALQEMLDAANSAHNTPIQASSFEDVFICNPSLPCYGFRSWDDFFTRRYRPGLRPVVSRDDDRVITNPCESQPFALTHDGPAKCRFSLKNRLYSLEDMLGNNPHASRFVGGTVFQGWLSALNYHRWHAPVSGTVRKVLRIPGTYFAADPLNGFENIDPATQRACPDRQAPDGSLKLISSIATRTVLLIQASNEALGMVGFVAIGMADVSSCVPIVAPGDFVSKGQEIGSFHYGGSSYCLVFEPHVRLHFSPLVHAALAGEYGVRGRCFAVNSDLASLR